MDGNSVFALVFIGCVVFAPLVAVILTYGLDPIAEKIVDYIDKRIKKD